MNRGAQSLLILLIVALLPGCNPLSWIKEKFGGSTSHGTGAPVISFGSRTMLAESDFKKHIDTIFNSQPGIEAALKQLPREQQLKIYEDQVEEKLIKLLIHEYVQEKGLNTSKEYKDTAREAHKTLDSDLDLYAFQQALLKEAREKVNKMSDDELNKYYTEHQSEAAFQREPFMKKDTKEFAPLSLVRQQIVSMLEGMEFQKLCNERVTELRNRLQAKVNKEYINSLVAPEAPAPAAPTESATEEAAAAKTPQAPTMPASSTKAV